MNNILMLGDAGLPYTYEGIPLFTDFRNMINVDIIMLEDEELSEHEKVLAALYQLYEPMPEDIALAIEGLKWFFSRGKAAEKESNATRKKPESRAYSFTQDAEMIFSGFYGAYKIDLSEIKHLHWWKFLALFENLPETTMMQRVIYWRTADLSKLSKHEKEHVKKMREIYALKSNRKPLTVEEIDQQTQDFVAQRYAEAQKMLAEKRKEQ